MSSWHTDEIMPAPVVQASEEADDQEIDICLSVQPD
jgi:hypothetical protein